MRDEIHIQRSSYFSIVLARKFYLLIQIIEYFTFHNFSYVINSILVFFFKYLYFPFYYLWINIAYRGKIKLESANTFSKFMVGSENRYPIKYLVVQILNLFTFLKTVHFTQNYGHLIWCGPHLPPFTNKSTARCESLSRLQTMERMSYLALFY